MTVETDLFAALGPLVGNRCYPRKAPAGAAVPYIVWQQVGGRAIVFLESAMPGKRNARIQVACWDAGTGAAQDVANLIRAAEEALVTSTTLRAAPIGAFNDDYEEDTERYGARQDFSIFY